MPTAPPLNPPTEVETDPNPQPCYLSASFRRVQESLNLCLLWKPYPWDLASDGNYVTGSRGLGEVSVTGLLQEGMSQGVGCWVLMLLGHMVPKALGRCHYSRS